MNKSKVLSWVAIILPIVVVAGLGSVFVNLGMDWFNALVKPSQWIPNIVIPIVWTVIYLAFTVILLLWQNDDKIPFKTIVLLIVNGALNVLWCLVFFTLNLTFIGNIVIILNLIAGFWLWLNIIKQKTIYGYILTIYPVWLSIATTLNIALWILN
ncbi:MAG TPA: hypothetical protein DCO89_02295 [Clostridiales bacterium]|nr:hypothetical protein [Clostridiales bacterium]